MTKCYIVYDLLYDYNFLNYCVKYKLYLYLKILKTVRKHIHKSNT